MLSPVLVVTQAMIAGLYLGQFYLYLIFISNSNCKQEKSFVVILMHHHDMRAPSETFSLYNPQSMSFWRR